MKIILRIRNKDFYRCHDFITNTLGGKRIMRLDGLSLKDIADYFYYRIKY